MHATFRSSSIFAPLRSLITHRSQQTAMLSCRAAKVSACVPKSAESAVHVTPLGRTLGCIRRLASAPTTHSQLTPTKRRDEAFSLVQGDHAYLDVRTADEFAAGHIEGAGTTRAVSYRRRSPTQSPSHPVTQSHSYSHSHSLASIRPRLAQGMYHKCTIYGV